MSIVAEYDWKTNTMTHHDARTAYREAVAAVAAKAHAKLPASRGRIDSAVKIVLAGDVELLPQGGARVASRSDASVRYHTVNGHCDCRDFARAPEGLCSHRLAYGIARRATEQCPPAPEPVRLPQTPPVETATAPASPVVPVPLPEAPASVNCHILMAGRQVQLTLRDTDEARLLQRLAVVLAQYPLPQPPAPAKGQPQGPADTTPQCPTHGALKRSTKGKGWYCPTKLDDDTWCPSKGT